MSQPTFKFPSQFGIFQTAHSDLTLALTKNDPSPICLFISLKLTPQTAQYTLSLPTSNSKTTIATGLATDLDPFYPSMVVMQFPTNATSKPVTLHMREDCKPLREFTFILPNDKSPNGELTAVQFKWKSSACEEVKKLGGSKHGMKLVKVGSGEVVAAFSRSSGGFYSHKKGQVGFVGKRLGGEFEVAVVMSLLALVEAGLQH